MNGQVLSAAVAIGVGILIAVALFVPFVYANYRRRGHLTLLRTLLWTAFLIYAMALWTYTLLPLPDPAQIRCAPAQLTPFQFLADIRTFDTSGPRALLHNPAVLQVAFNILLFLPLGILLRWLWGRGIIWSTVLGFAVSLCIETTQLTGLWGLYPCAYRLFDVDDLMANTAGALLGGVLAAAFALLRRLASGTAAGEAGMSTAPEAGAEGPSPVTADAGTSAHAAGGDRPALESSAGTARRPRPVSKRRRVLGAVCDLLFATLLSTTITVTINLLEYALTGELRADSSGDLGTALGIWGTVAVTGLLTLFTGRTPGDHAVAIRYASAAPADTRTATSGAAGSGAAGSGASGSVAAGSGAAGSGAAGSVAAASASSWDPASGTGSASALGPAPDAPAGMITDPAASAHALSAPGRILRWLGGIGGYQLISATGSLGFLFLLVGAVFVLATERGRGLPGILSRSEPQDSAPTSRT
jgi:glycopeptide antibiotics resistance protein